MINIMNYFVKMKRGKKKDFSRRDLKGTDLRFFTKEEVELVH